MSIITKSDERKLIEEYLAGVGTTELSNRYNYNITTICQLMRRKCINRTKSESALLAYRMGRKNRSQFTADNENQLIEEYLEGSSPVELSKKYGYSQSTLAKLLKRKGVLRSSKESANLAFDLSRRINYSGEKSPNWIKNRHLVESHKRGSKDSYFKNKILKDRLYTCELTGKVGGELQVHHIFPVWSHPELRYDGGNVIVIQRKIHKEFHRIFGSKTNVFAWNHFVKAKLYEKVI
jgi:Mor family transcriptional regulator